MKKNTERVVWRVSKAKIVSQLERALKALGTVNGMRQYGEWPLAPQRLEQLGALISESHSKIAQAKAILENNDEQ
jgi:hypothetical protein